MRPDDVVEISCVVENGSISPLPVVDIPEHQELLMRSVKYYERLAVEATLKRSRKLAVRALMAHPLVLSYSLSKVLTDEYLAAHAPYVGEWN
jgi:6-phospho-beta-glucosidase